MKKRTTYPQPRVLITPGSWHETIYSRIQVVGGVPRVLDLHWNLEKAYRWATHILLPGGADIHPAYYSEPITHSRPVEPDRDEVEYQLAAWALEDGKPIMGICRGHQMICVAAGGNLHQDIAAETHTRHNRYTHLNQTYGQQIGGFGGWLVVNSFHHQAVKQVPAGWQVTATSTDGLIESISHPNLPVVSVQWHPEMLTDVHSHNLFTQFVRLKP